MPRSFRLVFSSLLLAAAAACSSTSAFADQPVAGPALPPSQIALDIAPAKVRSPYDVQILREDGSALPTYALKDRFYVQGNASERYVIRVSNPTDHRIEAVVTVDGLDVIDGEDGDLRKRGYVVPPYGETRIEGFRTSQADVATFRFSSVNGSYAGQKGKARNVGVIAVALFEEQATPDQQIIVGDAAPRTASSYRKQRGRYDYRDDVSANAPPPPPSAVAPTTVPARPSNGSYAGVDKSAASEGAKAEAAPPAAHASAKKRAAAAQAPAPTGGAGARYVPPADEGEDDDRAMPPPGMPQQERLGLGTEFGEQRDSAASYTRFVRAPGRPVAIAELRYNDMAGLMALGITVQPLPDDNEIMMRETADPFPGYARPPGR
jgi:hypothetical protein